MTHENERWRDSLFPGWRWALVALSFPIAGYIGWGIAGRVDEPLAAFLGGTLTGAGLGAAQWYAARDAFGDARAWIAASAGGYGLGLLAGAVIVGYETGLGSLVAMGAISGVALGGLQGLALVAQGRARLGAAWGLAMPALLALGWSASTAIGVDVDNQFTVFGAMGAIVFTILTGALLTRFSPATARAA
jgi:hypothetical protein